MGSEAIPGLRLRKINVKEKDTTVSTVATLSDEADEPVTPAGRLFMEPGMNCYILCTLAFANPINVAESKQTFLSTLVNHKRFQSIIVSTHLMLTIIFRKFHYNYFPYPNHHLFHLPYHLSEHNIIYQCKHHTFVVQLATSSFLEV